MTQMENTTDALEAPSSADEAEELSLSTTFELLKNRRRRDTLEYLLEHDGESTLSDLAEHIAALENDIEIAQLSSDQRKRVYIGLYQCHLPKMDGAGVIDFDKHRGTVVLREEARQLVPYLKAQSGQTGTPQPDASGPASPTPVEELTPRQLGVSALAGSAAGLAVLALLSVIVPYALGGMWLGALVGVAATAAVVAVRGQALTANPSQGVSEPQSQ
jgi:hypothetical protein